MLPKQTLFTYLINKKVAFIAAIYILLVILGAIFAIPLSIDKSPYANRMTIEIGAKRLGYEQSFLKVPKIIPPKQNDPFTQFFLGIPDSFDYIPITFMKWEDSNIIVGKYVDENIIDTMNFSTKIWNLDDLNENNYENIVKTQFHYPLGTDRYGRDVWSRILIGSRVSLAVGLVTVLMSITIGLILGAFAGWYGGWVDSLIMYIVNVLWSIPTLLLVFAISLSLGKGFWEVFIAIGLTSWVGPARLIRGQVMQLKEMDYITAAKTLGLSDIRILWRHVLPNIVGPIIVIATANFANAILVEAGLSFLGIGVQPPIPSWGLMIKEHYNFLLAGQWVTAFIPGLAIMLLVLAFNILGNTLRDYFDVRN